MASCCAGAASGHAAVPVSPAMNSRRRILDSSIGSGEPIYYGPRQIETRFTGRSCRPTQISATGTARPTQNTSDSNGITPVRSGLVHQALTDRPLIEVHRPLERGLIERSAKAAGDPKPT